MDTLNQGKEDKNKDIIENNNKNNSGNRNTKSAQFKVAFITQAAVIAALYVVLVIMFNYCSFGPIQFRIAEALTILPYFTPAAIPGLFVGCLLSNILGGAAIWDIIFGSSYFHHSSIWQRTRNLNKPFSKCTITNDNSTIQILQRTR